MAYNPKHKIGDHILIKAFALQDSQGEIVRVDAIEIEGDDWAAYVLARPKNKYVTLQCNYVDAITIRKITDSAELALYGITSPLYKKKKYDILEQWTRRFKKWMN